jgi:hypothetical protein
MMHAWWAVVPRGSAIRGSIAAAAATAALLCTAQARAQSLEPPPALSQPAPGYPAPTYVPGEATSGPMTAPSNADDERKDSGLGLEWVWLRVSGGATYVGLDSINGSNLQLQTTKGPGWDIGFAGGVRLLFLSVGVSARDLQIPSIGMSLWELDGEVAFHTRVDHIDPYFGVRGGYTFDGSLGSGAGQAFQGSSPSGLSVHGWNAGPIIGCDYYFNHYVSLGLETSAEFLFLQRPPVQPPPLLAAALQAMPNNPTLQQAAKAYQATGSSVGFGADASLHVGVHF